MAMPILEKSKPQPAAVSCVHEIRVGVRPEQRDALERFYLETIGLVPWPNQLQFPGGWGLGSPQAGLLLQFRHDPEVDPVRRRFTLMVDCLATVEERLRQEEWPYERLRGFGWSDRCLLVHDPVGHLVEVRQSQQF
jgi:hypothetical protein